jgi:hypothetical protein
MAFRALRFAFLRRVAWFLADHGIMRERVENAFKRRLLSAAPAARGE